MFHSKLELNPFPLKQEMVHSPMSVCVPTTSTTLSSSCAIAIMKFSSSTNDLQLWFCILIF
jgi:hypothetical protein